MEAALDLMQTVPAFAYLIPLLLVFGFGPAAGMVVSVVFAMPPMVRNTMLGLRLVPPDIRESALMSGATGRQLFWLAEVPAALPRLLVGVNKTIMAALSMLVIAAMVGTRDLGQQVYVALGKADAGPGIVAGLSIAAIAMTADRMLRGRT